MAQGKSHAAGEPQLECEECIEDSDAPALQPSPCKLKSSKRTQERHISLDGIQGSSGQQSWQADQGLPHLAKAAVRPQQQSDNRLLQEQPRQLHVAVQHVTFQQHPIQQQQPHQMQQKVTARLHRQSLPSNADTALAAAAQDAAEEDYALIETSGSGGPGFDALIALHGVSSAMPFAASSFISNEVVTMGPRSQHRRLSVAIPGAAQGSGGSAAGRTLQSPVGGIMASLMAEVARSRSTALNTPWSAHNPSLVNLLSPTGAVLDGNPLASPRMPGLIAGNTLESSAEHTNQLMHLRRIPSARLAAEPPTTACMPAVVEAAAAQNHTVLPNMTQQSKSQQVGAGLVGCKRPRSALYDDGRCAEICHAAQAAALAAMGSPGTTTSSDLAALAQWQHTIEAAEQHWGPSHPAVGRAWLELARALQAVDKDSERAKLATKKAFDICQILLTQTAMESRAHESFQYLLDKFNRKATAAKQAAQTAAAYAAQEAAAAAAAQASAAAAAAATVVPVMPLGFSHLEGSTAASTAVVVPAVSQEQSQKPKPAYPADPVAAQPGVSAAMVFPAGYPATAVLQPHAGSIAPAVVLLQQQAAGAGAADVSSTQAAAHAATKAATVVPSTVNTAAPAVGQAPAAVLVLPAAAQAEDKA